MIAYLKGQPILDQTHDHQLIIVVNNVGYGVAVGSQTLTKIIDLAEVELQIYTHVREDRLELYGFLTALQKKLFLMLLNVSGVGPKTALEIADHDPNQVINAIQQAEISFFTPIPRLGKKIAQKIILDLRHQLGGIKELNLGPVSEQTQEVISALTSLGFEETQAYDAVAKLDLDQLPLTQAIKQAIKLISR